MELTFEQENFISDVVCEAKKLRELGLQDEQKEGQIVGFHRRGEGFKPVYDETQKLLDEVYADIPEEEIDLAWLDDLYEARKDAERDIQEDVTDELYEDYPNLYERGD
jgi:hypothetical protein